MSGNQRQWNTHTQGKGSVSPAVGSRQIGTGSSSEAAWGRWTGVGGKGVGDQCAAIGVGCSAPGRGAVN